MARKPRRLGEHTWLVPGSPNTIIVSLGDHVAVIDPGIGADRDKTITEALGSLGLSLTDIVLTHGHTDHLAAAPGLLSPDTRVHVHRLCLALVESVKARFNVVYGGVVSEALAAMPPVALRVTNTFGWGEEVLPGTRSLDLHGHTHGHSGIVIEDDQVVAAGDAVLGERVLARFGIPFAADLREWQESLARLRELAEAGYKIVPGHGPVAEAKRAVAMIDVNIQAVKRVREYVLGAIKEHGPLTLDKLAYLATRELSAAEPSPRQLLLNRTALVSVVAWLEEEGLVEPLATENGVAWRARQA